MKDATAAVGTSPEVLQHYLTAGIECELIESQLVGYEKGERSRMVSLNAAFPKARLDFDGARPWINTADMLPVLRPFSQLCQPLEDGTVPAVEVAKILLAHQHDVKHYRYEAAHIRKIQYRQPGLECIEVTVPGLNDNLVIAIYNNLDLENEDRGIDSADVLNVVSYLRSQHFAVGLEPHQYIAKSPAPALPATEKGEGG